MAATIERVIESQAHDLGGFEVRRLLPAAGRQMVGPFIFFDHIGPAVFGPGRGIDVRPHPHIGLATVTYLFEGEIVHRDSLNYVQPIRPGDVNWMTAGRGIVHSERTGEELRRRGSRVHGIQTWLALPRAAEETEPAFFHHPAASLPEVRSPGVIARVIAGTALGQQSPVEVFSSTLYVDLNLAADATFELSDEHQDRAVYVAAGLIDLNGTRYAVGAMPVLEPAATARIRALKDARVLLLGGSPLEGRRYIWWNFVSSSRERMEQAKTDWVAQRFGKVPGETEFIPLPQKPPASPQPL
ncbi:MAG TPA: pirin family protein [Steroidobacteraceae bacterium]|nr:pirin family protein [Steroidobacteraceae bacterium]